MEKRSERVEIPCRIRVVDILSGEEPKDLTRDMEILMETREKWINGIQKAFKEGSELLENIRPWDILLYLDGSITVIEKPIMESVMKDAFAYPVRFQIPSNVLEKFPLDEHPIRSEAFALGCLMYEIHTLSKPYANLEDKLVKQKYMNGEFPTHDDPDLLTRLREYIRANPAAFGFQVAGLVVSALSLLAVPILGLIGFTAIGPAAGTAAAGWQASLGIVQAGSLFAWCQVGLHHISLQSYQKANCQTRVLQWVEPLLGLSQELVQQE